MTHEELERERFRRKLDDLWLCVLGNGHPEQGLKWKVEELSAFMRLVRKMFWFLVTVVVAGSFSAIGLFTWKVIVYMAGNHAL